MQTAEVRFTSQEEYDRLRDIRDRHGVVWRGMLLQGARQVTGYDLHKALLQLDAVSFEPEQRRAHPQQHPAIDVYQLQSPGEGEDRTAGSNPHRVSSETSQESVENPSIPGASWEPTEEFDGLDAHGPAPERAEDEDTYP